MENLHTSTSIRTLMHTLYIYQQTQALCLNTTLFFEKIKRDSKNESHNSHSRASYPFARLWSKQTIESIYISFHFISSHSMRWKIDSTRMCLSWNKRWIESDWNFFHGNMIKQRCVLCCSSSNWGCCRCYYHLLTKARILVFAIYVSFIYVSNSPGCFHK